VSPLVLIGIAFGVLVLVGAGVGLVLGGNRSGVDERIEQFVGTTPTFVPEADAGPRSDVADRMDKAMAGRGFSERIKSRIAKADAKLRVSEYIMLQVLAAIGVGLASYFLLFDGNMVIAGIFAALGSQIPRMYLNYSAKRRLTAFDNQLSDTLNLLVNALRSGYSQLQGMEAVATELPAPVSVEFERVVQEVRLGLTLGQSLENMLRRVPSEDLDLVVTAVNIQREVGGNLAEILDIISFTIRERVRIKGEIRTLTAQGRISGWIITFLPVALSLILAVINPSYMTQLWVQEPPFLFTGFPCGWLVIGISLFMIIIGGVAIQKIVDIEV
jgi:tight adherence protein B